MTAFQNLIPLAALLLGVFVIGALEIWDDEKHYSTQWLTHVFVLLLALLQQLLLYRLPPTLSARGSMLMDGMSQLFAISILALALIVQFNRKTEKYTLAPQIDLMVLGITFFALVAVQTNRIFFGILSVVALIWLSHAALAAETENDRQPNIVHSGMSRGIILFLVGTVLSVLCYAQFGETRIDEIQRALIKGRFNPEILYSIEVFILFISIVVMGVPPFQGIMGRATRESSWTSSLTVKGILAIVGFSIAIRWGVFLFARPAVGGLELESLAGSNFLFLLRIVSLAGLVLVPLFSLFNSDFRGGLSYFMLNPFVQGLFALSYGQKDVLGFVMVQVLVVALIYGLITSTIQALQMPVRFTTANWVGAGYRNRPAAIGLLLAFAALAGLSPFFGSLLLQKTLSINSPFGFILLINVAISGFYVARLVILAFHRGEASGEALGPISMARKVWFVSQLLLLIFMGIFWQPLYKYGEFSIRSFFGEL